MGITQVRVAFLSLLLVAATAAAQEARQDVRESVQFDTLPPLPNGNNVWSVRMVRSGGFAGITFTATLTSEGKIACIECVRNFSMDFSKEDLIAIVPSSDLKAALVSNSTVKAVKPGEKMTILTSMCRDCFVTRMTVQHRDASGNVQTFFASWDDVTASGAPAELVRLANSIASLVK